VAMMRPLSATLAAASLLVVLTACFPGGDVDLSGPDDTPTPDGSEVAAPTPEALEPPALDGLVLTTAGLGTLEIGEDPAPGEPTDMVAFDPEFCTDARTGTAAGIAPGSEFAGLWVPIEQYGSWQQGYSPASFQVRVEDDVLVWIDVQDELIPTDAGVRIGDPDDVVLAAYPDVEVFDNDISELFFVQGTHGTIVVEVARNPPGQEYWAGHDVDRVIALGTFANDTEVDARAGTGGGPGSCPGLE